MEPGEKVVGIDLGTTNSAVAAMEAGNATVIPNAEGQRTTPSVVAYTTSGDMLVGQLAKRQAAINPDNTFYSVKRFVGRQPSEVAEESAEVAYKVESSGTQVLLRCPALGRRLSPEDVSAVVLRKLAKDAADYLKAKVKKAVVTVPAYFNDSQRQGTKDAGKIAGLQVIRIVNEPTAASLAYGLEKKYNETIMVFDLGGGTFDVSVLTVGDGVCEVLATNGDTKLGGDDFDKTIVDWLAGTFKQQEGIDLLQDSQAVQRLNEAAEKAKIDLSALQETTISLPFIATDESGPKTIDEVLTRQKFESLCAELVERCRGPVEQALEDASVEVNDLDEVVLVGGSTRIPAVVELAKSFLPVGKTLNQSVNPDEVVAVGAAIQGAVLTGEIRDLILLDVLPLTLSIATHDGLCSVFLPRNTRVPVRKTKVFESAKDNQKNFEIKVVQGERRFAKDNKELSMFILEGIRPAAAGRAKVEVAFDVDSNGILSISAKDLLTQNEQKVTVVGGSTLAPEDVATKIKDAQEAAEREAAQILVTLVKNEGEQIVFSLERLLREQRRQVSKDKIPILQSKLILLKEELLRDPLDAQLVKDITEDLQAEVKAILGSEVKKKYDKEQYGESEVGLKRGTEVPKEKKTAAL